jgi:hypothetical protein
LSEPINIQLGKAKVGGVDERASGLLKVWVPFEPRPPVEWLNVFGAGSGPIWPASMHPPDISRDGTYLRPPDEEVEMYINALQQQVDATNTYYNSEIGPELERQRQRKADQESDEVRRIEEAQRRLDAGS